MNKALLLTKSNLRKNRGTSVGLFLLIVIATCLIGISLLIFMDCYPSVSREAVRLNGGDGYISISGDLEGFTDEKIAELFEDDTDSYYAYHDLKLANHPVPFGNGEVVIIPTKKLVKRLETSSFQGVFFFQSFVQIHQISVKSL